MTTAYCAPGRETITAILLAYRDIEFDEVRASAMMADRTDVILVDDEALKEGIISARGALYELGRSAEQSSQAVRDFFRNYVSDITLTGDGFRMLSS